MHQFDDETFNQIIQIFENPVKIVMQSTYDRILEKGEIKGLKQGELIAKQKAVTNMLLKGFDIPTICEIQEVSTTFVLEIKKSM